MTPDLSYYWEGGREQYEGNKGVKEKRKKKKNDSIRSRSQNYVFKE